MYMSTRKRLTIDNILNIGHKLNLSNQSSTNEAHTYTCIIYTHTESIKTPFVNSAESRDILFKLTVPSHVHYIYVYEKVKMNSKQMTSIQA